MRIGLFILCFFIVGTAVIALPAASASKELPPTGWRKIRVGSVSFYVPPHLRRTGLPGNRGVIEALSGRHNQPYLYYAYGPHVPCAESDRTSDHRSEVVINGKRARLEFSIRSKEELLANPKDWHVLNLCVPDVDDGKNKFEIYATGLDLGILNAMKRSFARMSFS